MVASHPPGSNLLFAGDLGDAHSRMHGRTLKAFGENVLAYGAKGDGVTDDYNAIWAAIQAAAVSGGSVYFPTPPTTTGHYFVGTQIDVSPYSRMHFVGGMASPGYESGQFGRPPGVTIRGATGLESVFKFDSSATTGADGVLTFENLFITGPQTCVWIADAAQIDFRNFSAIASAGASDDNAAVVLDNVFWVSFERFSLQASATTKPAVLVKGTTGPNVVNPSEITFRKGVFNIGAVRYDQQVVVPGPITHTWLFQNVTLENCDNSMLQIVSSTGVTTNNNFHFTNLTFLTCDMADSGTGIMPLVRLSSACTLRNVTIISCGGPDTRAIQNDASAAVNGVFISNAGNQTQVTDPTGNNRGSFISTKAQGLWIQSDDTGGDQFTDYPRGGSLVLSTSDANATVGLSADPAKGLGFGTGSGGVGATYDTKLYREAAAVLKTAASFKTGASATGSRPSAATAGAGAQWYDTTLGKPIWSNGTVWKDAAGATV